MSAITTMMPPAPAATVHTIKPRKPVTIGGYPALTVLKTAAPLLANALGLCLWLIIL